MWLHRESICNILNLTEEVFLSKIKKHNQLATTERIELIRKELFKNNETESEIDKRCLNRNIKRMLSRNPPEKIFIGQTLQSSDEVNTTTESIDLDSSMMSVVDLNTSSMSYDDNDTEVELDPLFKNSKKELVRQLRLAKNQNSVQETELNFLRPIGNFFKCEQKRGGFSYMPAVDRIAVSLLSEGESSRGIVRFFEALASEFPVLKTSDCEMKKNIPRKSYINSLRDVLPNLNSLHLSTFLENTTRKKEKLTLSVDQTTISSNTGIMGMGVSDQSGNFHLIGLMQTTASKGLEIKEAMKQLLKNTGYHQQILNMKIIFS